MTKLWQPPSSTYSNRKRRLTRYFKLSFYKYKFLKIKWTLYNMWLFFLYLCQAVIVYPVRKLSAVFSNMEVSWLPRSGSLVFGCKSVTVVGSMASVIGSRCSTMAFVSGCSSLVFGSLAAIWLLAGGVLVFGSLAASWLLAGGVFSLLLALLVGLSWSHTSLNMMKIMGVMKKNSTKTNMIVRLMMMMMMMNMLTMHSCFKGSGLLSRFIPFHWLLTPCSPLLIPGILTVAKIRPK